MVLPGLGRAVSDSQFKVFLAVGGDVGVAVLELHGLQVADEAYGLGAAAVVVLAAGIVHALGWGRVTLIL